MCRLRFALLRGIQVNDIGREELGWEHRYLCFQSHYSLFIKERESENQGASESFEVWNEEEFCYQV